nr:MAG TPA: hypothetical protein [Caudoviricetes sp.]
MSSFFYTFSIQLLDAGRAEQNLEKLATCTIFSQKACVKLLLDFSRICGIIFIENKRGNDKNERNNIFCTNDSNQCNAFHNPLPMHH